VDAPGLRWGISHRFLRYIARMPDGRWSVTDGAEVVGERTFFFSPVRTSALDTGNGVLKYRGDVRFACHQGLLFIRIADPWLSVADDGSTTLSAVTSHDETPCRVPLVTLALAPSASPKNRRYVGRHAQLTEPGSELFNTVYPAGERFDDLTVLHHPRLTPQEMS
jgi:hypothetical protein